MSDPINSDGSAPDWDERKWGTKPQSIPEALQRVTFQEVPPVVYAVDPTGKKPPERLDTPGPLDEKFAVKPADVVPIRVGPWLKAGDWKWREFGRELQLRCLRLPHIPLDLFRGEAEALALALAVILSKPMALPYRIPWHERVRQWWLRRVWARKHHDELAEARAALIRQTIVQMRSEQFDAEGGE